MKKENPFYLTRNCFVVLLIAALGVPVARSADYKPDPATLNSCVGQYELGEMHFNFRRQGNELTCQVPREGLFNLQARLDKDFVLREVPGLGFTFKQDEKGKISEVVFHKDGEDYEVPKTSDQAPGPQKPDVSKIPPRAPNVRPSLLDLSGKFNACLDQFWQPDSAADVPQQNHLGAMPRGQQHLGEADFDVRGVIQLSSRNAAAAGADLPKEVNGIRVGQKCRRLHFLHGTQWRVGEGTRIGSYVVHYAGGAQAALPIIYGQQVRDWWSSGGEVYEAKAARVAWKGANEATQRRNASLRIFASPTDNPYPDQTIESVDFVSAMTDSAPFLIAITLE